MKQIENFCRPLHIELGEGVIQQQNRRNATRLANCIALQHAKRNCSGALLPCRAEKSQVARAQRERKIIAMRSGVRHAPAYVMLAMSSERILESSANVRLLRNAARVRHTRLTRLTNRACQAR